MNVSFVLLVGFLTIFDFATSTVFLDVIKSSMTNPDVPPTHHDISLESESASKKLKRGLGLRINLEAERMDERGFGFDHNRREYVGLDERGIGFDHNRREYVGLDERGFGFEHNRREYSGYRGGFGEFGYNGDYYRGLRQRHHKHGGYYNDDYNGGFSRYIPIF